MTKNNKNSNAKPEKRGYRPLNVGYSAVEPGYTQKGQAGILPKAPQGGTGETSRPSSPAGSAKATGQ